MLDKTLYYLYSNLLYSYLIVIRMPRKKKIKKKKKTNRSRYKVNGIAKLTTRQLSESSKQKYVKKLKQAI